ncbi:hypothetical protein OH492_11530 [Vibrio chagasii]|nr:hypothetical protein [Vibrio chagasii]
MTRKAATHFLLTKALVALAIANEETKVDQEDSINGRLHNQDLVRLGMAGNLAEYVLSDYKGTS